jgi:Mrp family chromosome partitioning ATPase
MSKILKALEHAQADARASGPRREGVGPADGLAYDPTSTPAAPASLNLEDEMVGLYQRLDALLPGGTGRVLEFIGSREGEGTSTVAGEFARVSAARFGKRVLLLVMDARGHAGGPMIPGPESEASGAAGRGTLAVAPLPQHVLEAPHADSQGSDAAWAPLRSAYDLILIDALPGSVSPLGLAMSRQADGVVLVIAADETRWPVAGRVAQNIERSGGRVLGTVLNKRRYHIPDWIYKHL